jgi:hypothetical protein
MCKKFKSELDIVNSGMWLYENGHFEEHNGLFAYWLFLMMVSFTIQGYFIYLAYLQVDFFGYIFTVMNLTENYDEIKANTCSGNRN